MQRLEIRRYLPEPLNGQNPYVLVHQALDADATASIVVAPLERQIRTRRLPDYELELDVAGEPFIILPQELAAQPKAEIGALAESAEALNWDIGKALDRLLFGV